MEWIVGKTQALIIVTVSIVLGVIFIRLELSLVALLITYVTVLVYNNTH